MKQWNTFIILQKMNKPFVIRTVIEIVLNVKSSIILIVTDNYILYNYIIYKL